ncbi:unnamed protein product [Rhizopus stolonifer]
MKLFESRIIRLLLTLLLLLFCLFSFYTLQNQLTTQNDATLTEEGLAITEASMAITDDNLVITKENLSVIDKEWIPKSYAPPNQATLDAIERNTIREKYGQRRPVKVLLMVVVNSGMMEYTLNWIASLKETGQDDRFLVFAIDQGVVDTMTSQGYGQQVTLIPSDWFHLPLESKFALWKSNAYLPITHAKTLVVERLLYLGVTVWFTDVDIVFLSPHIRQAMVLQMGDKDMVFSQEIDQRVINSGFYMIKPTQTSREFMGLVVQAQDETDTLTQQKVMNKVLRKVFAKDFLNTPFRLLDMLLFPNGCDYFRKNLPTKFGLKPFMLHANCLIGSKKKDALTKEGMWYI